MNKLFVEDLEVSGKKVIVRVDFNVPLKGDVVENDKRLVASLPTIKYLMGKGAKVILMSHLGRPKGQVKEEMRMAPVAKRFSELLGKEVKAASDCIGEQVKAAVEALGNGDVLLLENLRFHKEETDNEPGFAKQLADLADVYVNDAFGSAHRAHASTEGITQHMSQCACGYLMKKELDFLGSLVANPEKPFVAILGGAKISGKIDVIENLLPKVDKILIGGGMAYTFFRAQGKEIGKSLLDAERVQMAKSVLAKAGDKMLLPEDTLVTDEFDFDARKVGTLETVSADGIPADKQALDIGPKTRAKYAQIVKGAKTIVWNGPMGVFEIDATAEGTLEIAKALASATKESGAVTVIGGGDSAAAIKKANLSDAVSHVSTGGGASLEFLEGKQLPGVVALTDKPSPRTETRRRRRIIAGNWKMNLNAEEAAKLGKAVANATVGVEHEVVVCPAYPCLATTLVAVHGTHVALGAQDVHWEPKGAYTGKVSCEMLLGLGVRCVIIGHSEQRTYFHETNETVNKKVKAALAAGLVPIICVGERLEEREAGKTEAVVEDHVRGAYQGVSKDDALKTVIAYEPVWAIGTGKNATPEQAQEVHAFIRQKLLTDLYDADAAQQIRIQYGGSMKASNAGELLSQPDIDGGLVGGASLKADEFSGIVKA